MHVLYGCSMYDCCLYFRVVYFTGAVFTLHVLNVLEMSCVYCTVQMLCVLDMCCMSFRGAVRTYFAGAFFIPLHMVSVCNFR